MKNYARKYNKKMEKLNKRMTRQIVSMLKGVQKLDNALDHHLSLLKAR